MELKLKVNGNADALVSYLKNFEPVCTSILLEVDAKERKFVAKSVNEEKTSIRFSSVSFEDANIEILSNSGDDQYRVRFGIMNQLSNLIKVLGTFNDEVRKNAVDETEVQSFTITFNYVDNIERGDAHVYACKNVVFTSSTLEAKFEGFVISEFKYLPDETFLDVVYHMENPIVFDLTPSMVSDILSLSSIYKNANIAFVVEGDVVYVADSPKAENRKFSKKIATVEHAVEENVVIPIRLDSFEKLFKRVSETYHALIGVTQRGYDRIGFASSDPDATTKAVISCVVDSDY